MVVQNPLDRVPGDVVAEIRERATDARVPPRWILDRHPHHEVGHLARRYRPASTSAGAAVVLPGNQPPVPAENRVRRDDAGDLRQNPPAEYLASHRESTALGVGQAKWTWAKLLPEDPILLPEILDHVFLVAVHPASGREYEEAQSVGHSLRLLGEQPLAPTLFRRFANLGRFVAPYGVAVVVFFALVSVAGLSGAGEMEPITMSATGLTSFFLQEVLGGAALGLGFGYVGYHALKSIDDHSLELLITLALVMFMYTLSFWIHVSGPIAVVLAGLLIGNRGRKFAMSQPTREHVDAFWQMVDEILNAVLFLLIGLEVFAVSAGPGAIVASLLVVPIVLAARLVSVSLPITAMSLRGPYRRGIVPILTWCGLRGGISVAMMLSLPRFPARDYLLACTYAVVVFSILVQGLTVRRVLVHYGVGETSAS